MINPPTCFLCGGEYTSGFSPLVDFTINLPDGLTMSVYGMQICNKCYDRIIKKLHEPLEEI